MYKIAALLAIVILSLALMGSSPDVGVSGNRLDVGVSGRIVGVNGGFIDVDLSTLGNDIIAGEYWTPSVNFSGATKYYFDPYAAAGGDGSLNDPYQSLEDDIGKIVKFDSNGDYVSGSPIVHGAAVCVLLSGNHGSVVFDTYYPPALNGSTLAIVAAPSETVTFDYLEIDSSAGIYLKGFSTEHIYRPDWAAPGGTYYGTAPNSLYFDDSRRITLSDIHLGTEGLAIAKTWGDTATWQANVVDAIQILDVDQLHIQDCNFEVTNYGMKLLGRCSRVNIIGNEFDHVVGDAMQFGEVDSFYISGNYAQNLLYVNDNHLDFIQLWNSGANGLIEQNEFIARTEFTGPIYERAYQQGILIEGGGETYDNITVRNNIFQIDGAVGIALAGVSTNNIIVNNTLVNQTTKPDSASWYQWYPQVRFSGTGTYAVNCFAGNNICGGNSGSTGGTYLNNAFYNDGDFDDVDFVSWFPGTDPLTNDFHLRVSSGMVNMGTTVFAPFDDYAGTCRPYGEEFDIGAYEYDDGGDCGSTLPAGATHHWDALDHENIIIADGLIESLVDKIGSTDWDESPNSGRQPEYKATELLNSNLAVSFDGGDELAKTTGLISGGAYTVAYAYSDDNVAVSSQYFHMEKHDSNGSRNYTHGQYNGYATAMNGDTFHVHDFATATETDGYHKIVISFKPEASGTGTDGVMIVWLDGVKEETFINSDLTAFTADRAWLASYGGGGYFTGMLGELIYFDTACSDTRADSLFTYLERWDPPAPPVNVAAVAGDDAVVLTWDESLDNDWISYSIYRGTSTGSLSLYDEDLIFTSYNDISVTNDSTYYYAATSTTANGGESAESAEVSATPTSAPAGDPAISGVTGTIVDDGSVVIAGSNFGTKSPVEPFLWDTCNNQAAYSRLSSGDDVLLSDDGYSTAPWRDTGPTPIKYWDVSGDKRVSTFDYYHWEGKAYFVLGPTDWEQTYDKLYLSYWFKPSGDATDWIAANKLTRIWNNNGGDTEDRIASWQTDKLYYNVDTDHDGIRDDSAQQWNSWDSYGGVTQDWNRLQVFIDSSEDNDATIGYGVSEYTINTTTNHDVNHWALSSRIVLRILGVDAAEATSVEKMTFDMGEIYIDVTPARVELGDNAILSACTHREIQYPTDWTSTSVTVTLRLGTMPSGKAWLFVIDEDGVASAGEAITVP